MRYAKIRKIISFLLTVCAVAGIFGVTTVNAEYDHVGPIVAYGVDVSSWQGNIDWKKVKADGKDFAIIRAGTTKGKDTYFEENYKNATAAGLDVGCYMYTYATTVEEAEADADTLIKWLEGKNFQYPVYCDMEDSVQLGAGMTTALRTEMILAFLKKLNDAGYYTGVYANANWFNNYLDEAALAQKHETWLAAWPDTKEPTKDYSSRCGLWQYTDQGKVDGINGNVDLDVAYKDYPTIIKNGEKPGNPDLPDKIPEPEIVETNEEWVIAYADSVNVRSGPGTNHGKISALPRNSRIHITAKYDDRMYVWGRFDLNGQEAWCVLDYSKQVVSELVSNDSKITIDKNKLILGLNEGEEVYEDLFKVNGLAEIKIQQTKNGFGTGTQINLMLGNTVVDTYYVVIDGDINGDLYIDAYDLTYITALTNFEISYNETSPEFMASDLNKDGVCDVFDCEILSALMLYDDINTAQAEVKE